MVKDTLCPHAADWVFYYLRRVTIFMCSLFVWLFTPLSGIDYMANVLCYLGVLSVGAFPMIFAGWSSNSLYSILGRVRAIAQVISYEIRFVIFIMSVILSRGSFNMSIIMKYQSECTNLFLFCPFFII